MTRPAVSYRERYVVYGDWSTGYFVGPSGGVVVGLPAFRATRDEAQREADALNIRHGVSCVLPTGEAV